MHSFSYNIFAKTKGFVRKFLGHGSFRIHLRMLLYNLTMILNFKQCHTIEEDDIYDYKNNIIPKRMVRHEKYYGNIMYGTDVELRLFSGYKGKYNGYVEHGMYLNLSAPEAERYQKQFKNVITFSDFRIQYIRYVNKNINPIAIGPYIHYSRSKSEEYIQAEKNKNGKTLLVFPQHSSDDISVEFDCQDLIKEIERVKAIHSFEKILVCLYFRDIMLGRDEPYITSGYTVVSSGYKEDPLFLARQKTFLLMCDGVLSNDVGTYVGYAIYLGKPVYVWNQSKRFVALSHIELSEEKTIEQMVGEDRNEDLERLFNNDSMIISEEQRNACEYYWGYRSIKTPNELKEILERS